MVRFSVVGDSSSADDAASYGGASGTDDQANPDSLQSHRHRHRVHALLLQPGKFRGIFYAVFDMDEKGDFLLDM